MSWESTPSFIGRRWRLRGDQGGNGILAQRVLAARGLEPAFLTPPLGQLMSAATGLVDFNAAADTLAEAVRRRMRICVFGDYDVDGATSTAILVRFFRMVGITAEFYVPDRIQEGYGPNAAALRKLKDSGIDLVICVDSGITAFDALNAAQQAGLPVVVIDHHAGEERMPPALAIVNPNRLDEDSGLHTTYGRLCAAGLSFLVANATMARLKATGHAPADMSLKRLLDLVALGTVADVVPLQGLNRAYVQHGLRVMGEYGNPGIAAIAGLQSKLGRLRARHLGFVFGPRVNATGRIGSSRFGALALTTDDASEAAELAMQLETLNEERRAMCEAVEQEAVLKANPDAPVIIVSDSAWHPGIIGIVAGRLKERFDRPTFVISMDPKGLGKGSARSTPSFDIGRAVIAARNAGLLVAGGGHPMAAGITVRADRLDEFAAFVAEAIKAPTGTVTDVDVLLTPGDLTVAEIESLETLEPTGQGNPPAQVAVTGIVRFVDVKKEHHLSVTLEGGGRMLKTIAFNVVGTPLGDGIMANKGRTVTLLGEVGINEWNDRRTPEMRFSDARAGGL